MYKLKAELTWCLAGYVTVLHLVHTAFLFFETEQQVKNSVSLSLLPTCSAAASILTVFHATLHMSCLTASH